jgi:transposase
MSRIEYSRVIKEAQERLRQEERKQSKAFVRDRIRFLRLLKSGRRSSQQQAGALTGYSARHSQRLWKQYREGGLKGLLVYPYKGLPCRLSPQQKETLQNFLAKDEVQFLHEAKQYIQQQFGVCYSTSAVHYLFRRLRNKKKTGRPSNYRKDEKGARLFKKSSLNW